MWCGHTCYIEQFFLIKWKSQVMWPHCPKKVIKWHKTCSTMIKSEWYMNTILYYSYYHGNHNLITYCASRSKNRRVISTVLCWAFILVTSLWVGGGSFWVGDFDSWSVIISVTEDIGSLCSVTSIEWHTYTYLHALVTYTLMYTEL